MDFSHYAGIPVQLAVDLINTVAESRSDITRLNRLADLESLLESQSHWWTAETLDPTDEDLFHVQRLRDRLEAVFDASSVDQAAEILNDLLDENLSKPRLSLHSQHLHLHFEPLGAQLHQWVAVVTAMGLSTALVDHGLDRFGRCSADGCTKAFIDTSKNRSRKHCSTACANRMNSAAHRRRLATSASDADD